MTKQLTGNDWTKSHNDCQLHANKMLTKVKETNDEMRYDLSSDNIIKVPTIKTFLGTNDVHILCRYN